ncbi:MAG: GNAT family N-acetyltransferase [Halothiobacillaceae bacterium]
MSDAGTQYRARLVLPLRLEALSLLQHVARLIGLEHAGLETQQCNAVELAMEEAFVTIRQFSVDESEAESAELTIDFAVTPDEYHVLLCSHGQPFDFSLIRDFDPDRAADLSEASADQDGLSVFLLKHIVDHYALCSRGAAGWTLALIWNRPQVHIADYQPDAKRSTPAADATGGPGDALADPVVAIEPLDGRRAIDLARLIYRSYGYSYVYEDIYYPERIRRNHREGTLSSWVARTRSGALVGHVALMRANPAAQAVEWGMAVVDPAWRGQGVMKGLLAEVLSAAERERTPVLFAHAVTAHPYTQRTCLDYGFEPVALLLGYAPATLRFRGIAESLAHRESTFIWVRLQDRLPRAVLHLPPAHAPLLLDLFASLGIEDPPLAEGSPPAAGARDGEYPEHSEFSTRLSSGLNVATIELSRIGRDHERMIRHELRRLCLERIDVILLMIDLTDPGAPAAARAAQAAGFVFGGWMPMQPWPYTLVVQYLDNVEVDFSAVCAEGQRARRLLETIRNQTCALAEQ